MNGIGGIIFLDTRLPEFLDDSIELGNEFLCEDDIGHVIDWN